MPETATEPKRPCVSIEFADLVAGVLNQTAWSQSFTAKRTWQPIYDLEELYDTLVACVVPRGVTITKASRGRDWHDPVVEIGLLKKPKLDVTEAVPEATRAELLDAAADSQAGLVEEVCDHFRSSPGRVYRGVGMRSLKVNVIKTETTTLMLDKHLEELGQLTSVIRLTGRTLR